MNYLSRPSRKSAQNEDFKDTYYKVNLNLSKLKSEIQKNQRLGGRHSQRGSLSSPKKAFDETLRTEANTYTAAKRSTSNSFNDTPFDLRKSVCSRNSVSPSRHYAGVTSSPYKTDIASAIERRHRIERALKEAQISRILTQPPPRFDTYERNSYKGYSPKVDKRPDIKDDIQDVKMKLNRISNRLNQRTEDIKDELEYLETSSARGRRLSAAKYVPETTYLTRPLDSQSRMKARRRSIEARSQATRSFLMRDPSPRVSADRRDRRSVDLDQNREYFEANYSNIGGNPSYYPDAAEEHRNRGYQFCTSMDYQAERQVSPPRPVYTETRVVRRSSRSRSPCHDSCHMQVYGDLDCMLETCKVKRNILKAKLDHAEERLREVARTQTYQNEIERSRVLDFPPEDDLSLRNRHMFRNSTSHYQSRKRDSSAEEAQRLARLKEQRTVHNHDLNIMKRNYDFIRDSEPSMNHSRSYLDQDLETTSPSYSGLLRENTTLKGKMRTAQRLLETPF